MAGRASVGLGMPTVLHHPRHHPRHHRHHPRHHRHHPGHPHHDDEIKLIKFKVLSSSLPCSFEGGVYKAASGDTVVDWTKSRGIFVYLYIWTKSRGIFP